MSKRAVNPAMRMLRDFFVRGALAGVLLSVSACASSTSTEVVESPTSVAAISTTISPTNTMKPVTGKSIAIGVVFADSAKALPLFAGVDSVDGLEAAANIPGGGVAGRPLFLMPCTAHTDVALADCAKTFSENGVYGVVVANDDMYSLQALEKMAKDFPVVVANPSRISTLTSRSLLAVTAGTPGLAQGMAIAATRELKAEGVAVVHFDDAESNALFQSVIRAVSVKLGAKPTDITEVVLRAKDSAKEMTKALGAVKSMASVVISLVSGPACNQLGSWVADQQVSPKVIAIESCAEEVPASKSNGWFLAHYGDNSSREAVRQAVTAMINVLALRPARGLSALTFGSLMNSSSGDVGPFLQTPLCGEVPVYPALCSSKVGVARLTNGLREELRGGLKSPAIDLFAELDVVGS